MRSRGSGCDADFAVGWFEMRIDTTVAAVQLPSIFRNLFTIAPWEWWQRREKELKGREEKNPYLTAYFDENFSLERALFQAIKYRKATTRYPSISGAASIGYYQLYSFTHAIVNTHAHLSSRGQTRLRGSLKDGLNSEYGLTPIALEMAVAVHLWSTGFDVDFTDMEGRGQFDFLANREGIELEVDCKTASGDVGRSIHRYRMLELLKLGASRTPVVGARGWFCDAGVRETCTVADIQACINALRQARRKLSCSSQTHLGPPSGYAFMSTLVWAL
jgi:hypothetical protein